MKIQQWNDYAGTGLHVANATAGTRPYYITGAINFNPVIRFTGSNATLSRASVPSTYLRTTTTTTFYVVAGRTSNNSTGIVFRQGNSNTNYIGLWS